MTVNHWVTNPSPVRGANKLKEEEMESQKKHSSIMPVSIKGLKELIADFEKNCVSKFDESEIVVGNLINVDFSVPAKRLEQEFKEHIELIILKDEVQKKQQIHICRKKGNEPKLQYVIPFELNSKLFEACHEMLRYHEDLVEDWKARNNYTFPLIIIDNKATQKQLKEEFKKYVETLKRNTNLINKKIPIEETFLYYIRPVKYKLARLLFMYLEKEHEKLTGEDEFFVSDLITLDFNASQQELEEEFSKYLESIKTEKG